MAIAAQIQAHRLKARENVQTNPIWSGRYPTIPIIPLFYHSGIPTRCLLRQTNPISGRAEGRTSAVWIRSCDEWDTGEAVEKQSQFRGHGRSRPRYSWARRPCYGAPAGVTANRASAPNEPNSGAGRRKDKCCVDNELRRMGRGSGVGKTKPILRLRIGGQTSRLGPAQANCAKQTQFPGHGRSRPWYAWAGRPCHKDALRRHYERGGHTPTTRGGL
jgi:hypothetical protein